MYPWIHPCTLPVLSHTHTDFLSILCQPCEEGEKVWSVSEIWVLSICWTRIMRVRDTRWGGIREGCYERIYSCSKYSWMPFCISTPNSPINIDIYHGEAKITTRFYHPPRFPKPWSSQRAWILQKQSSTDAIPLKLSCSIALSSLSSFLFFFSLSFPSIFSHSLSLVFLWCSFLLKKERKTNHPCLSVCGLYVELRDRPRIVHYSFSV